MNAILERWPESVTDWVPSKRSVLLQYDLLHRNLALSVEEILAVGEEVLAEAERSLEHSREFAPPLWSIPVCYDGPCALDRAQLEQRLAMDWDQVVRLHVEPIYRVVAVGFSPGFAYMDGLPEALRLPRKRVPSLRVPKGSVAIAEQQCGIYPVASPGGWYVLGRTALALFAADRWEPSLLRVGDRVQFVRQAGVAVEGGVL